MVNLNKLNVLRIKEVQAKFRLVWLKETSIFMDDADVILWDLECVYFKRSFLGGPG